MKSEKNNLEHNIESLRCFIIKNLSEVEEVRIQISTRYFVYRGEKADKISSLEIEIEGKNTPRLQVISKTLSNKTKGAWNYHLNHHDDWATIEHNAHATADELLTQIKRIKKVIKILIDERWGESEWTAKKYKELENE